MEPVSKELLKEAIEQYYKLGDQIEKAREDLRKSCDLKKCAEQKSRWKKYVSCVLCEKIESNE